MKKSLGAVMKQARGGMSQEDVCERLGIEQPSYSRWERDQVIPPLDMLIKFDKETGHKGGYVLIAAGWVEDLWSVEQALAGDRSINDDWKDHVLRAYRAAQELSRRPVG